MTKKQIESTCEELVQPIIEERGFELVDVEYVKEGSTYYLRVYADKPGGITIDDCVEISRELNPKLDAYEKEFKFTGVVTTAQKGQGFCEKSWKNDRDQVV